MGIKWLFIVVLPIVLNCTLEKDGWKDLDLGHFKMSIPKEWNYVKEQGDDSFVGKIVGPKITLEFDFSTFGYAGDLTSTEKKYTESQNIRVDKTEKYIIQTTWPKVPSKGITGIYFKERSSTLTFNMVGVNLSQQDEDLALKAFKTISIK